MGGISIAIRETLERSGPGAVLAGGLLFVFGGVFFSLLNDPAASGLLFALGGLVLLPGIVGICSVGSDGRRWPALLASVLAVATALACVVLGVVSVARLAGFASRGSLLPSAVPSPVMVVFLLLGLGLGLAGVVVLPSPAHERWAGILLLVAALSYPTAIVGGYLFEPPQAKLANFLYAVFGVALLLAATRLHVPRLITDCWVPPRSAVEDGDGWTNEHVREGFDVDGSSHPGGRQSATRRLQYQKIINELRGPITPKHGRGLYDFRRRLGRLLNREAAVEQAIAEQEYMIETVTESEGEGWGSADSRLGLIAIAGIGLLAFGLGKLLATALFVAVGAQPLAASAFDLGITLVFGGGGIAVLLTVRQMLRQVEARA